jgi:hypothetical protein
MNEQLKKLVEKTVAQTTLEFSNKTVTITAEGRKGNLSTIEIPVEFVEKFAELLIEECMNRVSKWNTFHIDENDKIYHSNIADDINEDLRKHFGVE